MLYRLCFSEAARKGGTGIDSCSCFDDGCCTGFGKQCVGYRRRGCGICSDGRFGISCNDGSGIFHIGVLCRGCIDIGCDGCICVRYRIRKTGGLDSAAVLMRLYS